MIFDEQEQPQVPQTFPVSPQPPQQGLIPFPAEAQRTMVGGADLPVPFDFGWLYLNLNTTVAAAGADPPEDPAAAQAWVTVEMKAQGRFSVGFDAIQLDSACSASHFRRAAICRNPPPGGRNGDSVPFSPWTGADFRLLVYHPSQIHVPCSYKTT